MQLKFVPAISLLLFIVNFKTVQAQLKTLTLQQQAEDFIIFKSGLIEGHAGLYYFIDEKTFNQQCDSISHTFLNNASVGDYYLKLRYLVTLLNQGHTRLALPAHQPVNFIMAVLQKDELYLPLQLIVIKKNFMYLPIAAMNKPVPKELKFFP